MSGHKSTQLLDVEMFYWRCRNVDPITDPFCSPGHVLITEGLTLSNGVFILKVFSNNVAKLQKVSQCAK